MKEAPLLLATSFLLAAFVLSNFVDMYAIPMHQSEFIDWLSWIFGIGGIVVFISTIATHGKRR